MKRKQLPAKKPNPKKEIEKLSKRLEDNKAPIWGDVDRLGQLLADEPGPLYFNASTPQIVRSFLIEKIDSDGLMQARMLAEVYKLKQDFDYDAAPPLEQLLIDHILTLRLRIIYVEFLDLTNQGRTLAQGAYMDNLLTTAQTRYLRAIEMLAKVRRLARNTPSLQINIAQEGGKQVNVQGDVNGQKAPAVSDL
jgi:hypothetical protein